MNLRMDSVFFSLVIALPCLYNDCEITFFSFTCSHFILIYHKLIGKNYYFAVDSVTSKRNKICCCEEAVK